MKTVLRKCQQEAFDASFDKLSKGVSKQIICLATGVGKTKLAAKIASNGFKKILFMTHVEELMSQGATAMINEFYPEIDTKEIQNQYGDIIEYCRFLEANNMFVPEEQKNKFGIIKADLFNISTQLTFASYQTIHRRLDRIPSDTFDLIIIDECHLAGAVTVKKTLDYLKPKLLIGLSATPYRENGANLGDIFDEIVYQYNIGDAIADGYLCEFDAIQIKTQINLDNVHTLGGDFNKGELRATVDVPERNKLMLDSYRQYANGLQSVIFCVDVEHAKNVWKVFTEAGELAEILVGDEDITPDRLGVIQRFKSGETTHLINVSIATTGFDHPGIRCILDGAPSKSRTRVFQKWGRGGRTLAGVIDGIEDPIERKKAIKASKKPCCFLLDFIDNTTKHRVINTWTLESSIPAEKRVFITSEKKEKLVAERKKREFEALTKQDKRVNLFKLPEVKMSTSYKMKEDATEKQLALLKDLGYDTVNSTYTKGSASEIISNLPATEKQVNFLKWKKFDVSKGVTRSEALLAFKMLEDIEQKKKQEEAKQKVKEQASQINNIIEDIL